jgi:hypothetical protein
VITGIKEKRTTKAIRRTKEIREEIKNTILLTLTVRGVSGVLGCLLPPYGNPVYKRNVI